MLQHKNAVIYGAGGAIGGAVARAFAREGAKVFLGGRTLAKLEAVAKDIVAAGAVAETAVVNALDEQAIEKHVDAVIRKVGAIDIFVQQHRDGRRPGDAARRHAAAGLHAPDHHRRHDAVSDRPHGGAADGGKRSGVILTITAGPPEKIAYIGGFGPACGVIEGLWRGFAAELGPSGVRVICLRSAGSPDTPDVQQTFKVHAKAIGVPLEDFLAQASSGTLLKRLPTSAEVANVATIMASDRAGAMARLPDFRFF
jgi:3-oxoacyl-[acyl-carrier protein] reductase